MVRDILAARCDVACVLSYVHRRMYTGNRNILQITFRRGNEVPKRKRISTTWDTNVLCARYFGSPQLTHRMYYA